MIHGADAEGQSSEGGFGKSCFLQYSYHLFSLWECLDRTGEVRIGGTVFRDESAIEGEHGMGVEVEELAHGECHGGGEFHDTQMASGFQYPADLSESLVEVCEVTDAEGCRHGIEGIAVLGEVQTVFFVKRDDVLQAFLLHFLTSDLHHALADVCPYECGGLQQLGG